MRLKELLESGIDLAKVFPERLEIADGKIILERTIQASHAILKFDRQTLHEKGWPINPGTFEIRDPTSPVAVVCPAQNSVLQQAALFYGAAISGPMITPDRGIELVVTNIISNPNLRWLILAGKDSGHLAGDVIYSLWKYGRDQKTKRVLKTKCPTNPYLLNLPEEAVNRFRKQVRVINLLGNYSEENAEQMKLELGLIVRCCLQEPENALRMVNSDLGDEFCLFDSGTEGLEPIIVDLNVEKIGVYYEGYDRVGTTVHVKTVAEAYPVLMSHIIQKGSWGMQESTRMALGTVATQTVIHDVNKDLYPPSWQPFSWMKTDKDVRDYLEKYRIWVYLFPLSDVKYDETEMICVPYLPERMDYVYGGRLTSYWYELADKKEKREIRDLAAELHQRFRYKLPTFQDVIEFYERLADVQRKSFNQLWKTAKAAKLAVKEGFGNSYRLYMSLQTPPIDIKEDPRQAHNPCFALYEAYPRCIEGKWQLDTVFFLRAHDILAFPANANGGIVIQKFFAWYAGIKPGLYIHHAGSIEVCDYLLPREIREKYLKQ